MYDSFDNIFIDEDYVSEMTLDDVKKLKPYWNMPIVNFKKNGKTPKYTLLQMAIYLNKKLIVGYLLARKDLDINALSKNNQTALMIACEKKVPIDWVEAILERGGDLGINLKDNLNETALDKCNYNSKVYKLLLNYGAVENKDVVKYRGNLLKPSKMSDSIWRSMCGCGTRCYK